LFAQHTTRGYGCENSGKVQEAFDYVVGKNIEEELPITTFKPEEFAGVE